MAARRVPKPLVRELRAMMRDYPEVNYLTEDEESSDKQYARALWAALEDLNLMPPVFDREYNFESIPSRMVRLVLDLAVPIVLNELCIWMTRNEFTYQSGNTSVRLYDRWRSYLQLANQLEQAAKQAASAYKIKINCDNAWGANLTEMFDAWRTLDPADWVTVTV